MMVLGMLIPAEQKLFYFFRGYYDEPHSKDAWGMVINPLTGSYIPIEYGIDRIDDHTLSTMF